VLVGGGVREAIAHAGPTDRVPPFRFSAVSRVSVADTDLGAVAYYGRYAHHLDRAAIAYRRHLGIPPLGPEGHVFVVRSLAVDYRASARFDDEVEAFVRVTDLGRTVHTMQARLERLTDAGSQHLADARLVIVGLAAYGGRPSRMPAVMHDAVAAFEGLPGGAA
jgi:acyl-CoA thioester hydrolase